MTTLESRIRARLEAGRRPLLMTHVVCGYPSFDDNRRALDVMATHGADLVELQFPFSEPTADGPLFVRANQLSIEAGTTTEQCFEFLAEVSAAYPFETLMMGYYNTAFRLGAERFAARLADAGGRGFILPDLPLEEAAVLHAAAQERDLAPVMLMTPTNTDARLEAIAAVARGMVYAVARTGVTGARTDLNEQLAGFLDRCRRFTDLPIGVGFGISEPEHIRFIGEHADVAVVGSAALRAWEQGGSSALDAFFRRLLG